MNYLDLGINRCFESDSAQDQNRYQSITTDGSENGKFIPWTTGHLRYFFLSQIKDMQSEYLVRFVGACLDPPCLVNEYCSKGSLQVVRLCADLRDMMVHLRRLTK